MNAICPGYINTEMVQAVPKDVLEKNILPLIPIGRLGEPEEIARCVVFLASDDAGLITGSTLLGQRRAVFRLRRSNYRFRFPWRNSSPCNGLSSDKRR